MRHNERNNESHHRHSHNVPSYHDRDHSWHHHHDHHHSGHTCDIFATNNFFFDQPHDAYRGAGSHELEQAPSNSTHATPPDPSLQSCLSTEIGGYAWASGIGTIATGSVVNTIENLGNCTIAFGDAIFSAAGQSAGHGGAQAEADTFLSVTGADILIEFTHDTHVAKGCYSSATSEIQYLAIDIYNWTAPNGPITIDYHFPLMRDPDSHHAHHACAPINNIDGNFADVIALAEAAGGNTVTSTITQALTIENQFSMVAGLAAVAA